MSYTLNKTGVQIDAILDRAETGGEIDQELALKAPLASPALTGTPTAPTPAEGDSSTKIATTEFVAAAVAGAITDTAGPADVVTIPDGSDAEMLSYKASIEPIQDLHGYANPWPGGGGKNKFDKTADDPSNGYVANQYLIPDGTTGNNSDFAISEYIPIKASQAYVFSNLIGNLPAVCFYNSGKAYISGQSYLNYSTVTFTTPATAAYLRFSIYKPNIGGIQLEEGSSPTAWTPYSNECPISGWTGANGVVTATNIWDEEWESGLIDGGTGLPSPAANWSRSKNFIPIKGGQSYYLLITGIDATYYAYAFAYDATQTFIGMMDGPFTTSQVITPSERACYLKFEYKRAIADVENYPVSINYPSTDTTYHAYNGTTYPIDWTDEAGTVYKGEVDFVSGELTASGQTIDLGSLSWGKTGTNLFYSSAPSNFARLVKSGSLYFGWGLCSQYNFIQEAVDTHDMSITLYYNESANNTRLFIKDSTKEALSEADFKTAMSGVQFVYELETPQTYQLDPVAVRTLLGVNNCWTDTGETEIEYKADLKLYIDKKIAEAI